MAASKAMDRVIDQINALKNEMHEFRHEVNQRLTAVETKLGMVSEKQKGFYERTMDYLFKAGFGLLTAFCSYLAYLLLQLHPLIK